MQSLMTRKRAVVSAEDVRQWRALRRDGKSYHEISLSCGISASTIHRRLKAAGEAPTRRSPRKGRYLENPVYLRMAQEYRRGHDLRTLAQRHGVTYNTAARVMREMGVRPPKAPRRRRCNACGVELPYWQIHCRLCAACLLLASGSKRMQKSYQAHGRNERFADRDLAADAAAGRLICGLPLRGGTE